MTSALLVDPLVVAVSLAAWVAGAPVCAVVLGRAVDLADRRAPRETVQS